MIIHRNIKHIFSQQDLISENRHMECWNKDYDDKFYWSKTRIKIKDIIISYMLSDDDKNSVDLSELISFFEQIQNKKNKFCIYL